MHKLILKDKYNLLFIFITIIGFFLDYYWIKIYDLIPAWDQGYHLSNLYKYSNLLQELNILDGDWWSSFWSVTDSYRGPLTYIVSAIFINIFGKTLDNSILSNFIFNLITILSIYEICRKYCTKEIGLWATYIYTFNPFIFNLRNDYLIDISQVSFIIANWLFLTKWYLSNKTIVKYSSLSGIFAGLLFLTKPTAIVFFILPISILYLRKITSFKLLSSKVIIELLIFPISFIFIIYPWVSKNWLTIFTSIINSFSWGLKYQEGLEINTIEGWYYYPLEIFKILNPILIFSIIFLYLIKIYKQKFSFKSYFNFSNILNKLPKNINWWIALPLNILLINILMSSKDPRFILPVIPLLCILMGKIIYNFRNKYYLSINSKIYLIILIIILLITQQFNTYNSKFSKSNNLDNKANIIHKEIVNTVSKESPYLDNIIGFIPDTKEFNAFNLNAEALRINNHIKVSQIISNKNTYESELKRYDWFIVKTADQGVMVNEGKKKLSNLLLRSNSFKVFKKWNLADNSELILIKRKKLSEEIKFESCKSYQPNIILNNLKNGFELIVNGKIDQVNNKNIIIDLKEKNKLLYFSIPEIKNVDKKNKCISFTTLLNSNVELNQTNNYSKREAIIFDSKSRLKNNLYYVDESSNYQNNILKTNKIEQVKLMGNLLKDGDFNKLFEIAGLLNQSDPDQIYLKKSEIIFKERLLSSTMQIDDLYSLAISQILQREAKDALETIKKISEIDKYNPQLYLARSIVETYLLDFQNARLSIEKAKFLNKDKKNEDTINTSYSILKLFSFKFLEGLNELI